MAQLILNVSDDKVALIREAFNYTYTKPDGVSDGDWIERKIKEYISGVIRQCKVNQAIDRVEQVGDL